ncbi:ATP-binding protein [Candidatus Woesearchaeota archaeon]|nr:ATP-binding protein [Candidatus Woesearchaeota archaeon]
MNTVWFRELGFHNNPFSIKPAAFHDQVIGFDKIVDEISYGILNNKIVLVEGDYGNGKSSILKRLLNDFGGKKQVIYYSCNRMDAHLNVKMLLNGRYGFLGQLFDMKPKDMILLLDEAQELRGKDYERLYSYYQEGYIKSIVLVGKGIKKSEIVSGFKNHTEEVGMHKMNEDLALQVIKRRVGELPLLPDIVVRKIYQRSDNNVRIMLKTCEEVCKKAVETGRKRVTEDFLKQFFQEKDAPVAVDKKVELEKPKPEVKKEEVKVEEKKVAHKTVIIDRRQEKKEEAKVEEKPKAEVKKEEQKKEEHKVEEDKNAKGGPKVYRPDDYKMLKGSAEELLNKQTDEIFGDEQYY